MRSCRRNRADGLQQPRAVAQFVNTEFLQVRGGQIAEALRVDLVFGEGLGVLRQPEILQPGFNVDYFTHCHHVEVYNEFQGYERGRSPSSSSR